MTMEKARVATGNKVVDLTRYIMARDGLTQDIAYAKLYRMELFKLLSDPETRLPLEDDVYLQKAYEVESAESAEAVRQTTTDRRQRLSDVDDSCRKIVFLARFRRLSNYFHFSSFSPLRTAGQK